MKRWLTLGLCLVAAAAHAAPAAGAARGGDLDAALQLYLQMKEDGSEIPAWLNDMINPPGQAGGGADRDGGETMGTATAIPFSPGGTYTDNGTTLGKANDYNSDVPGLYCNYGSFYTSSFGAADVFYTFTLTDFYTVTADICGGGTWDTAMGILDASGTLVAYNDDNGAVCVSSTLRSAIPACCLPAGTYYIVVDAYSTGTGPYTLNVAFGSSPCVMPCTTYTANITTLNAPGTATGSTVGDPHVYAGAGGDQGIDITLPYAGDWNFDACVAGTNFACDLYLFSANPCTGGTLITSNTSATCASPSTTARLLAVGLQAGTYHLLVGHTSTTEGNFAVQVSADPARPTTGGPDAFGYAWRNSLNPLGPTYDWVEISGTGTPITLASGSSYAGPFPLGMTFPFYGTNYTSFYVSSEGFLSFNALTSSYTTNATIPTAAVPNNIIAAFWDDLNFTAGVGRAYYLYDVASGRFILEFKDFYKTSSTNLLTFQIILKDNGDVLVQHQNLPELLQNSATLGLENSTGTTGLLVNFNNAGGALYDGLATSLFLPEADEFPPLITHTALPTTEQPGPYTVNANITDTQSGVAGAELHYQFNSGGYTTVAMTAGTPPAYSASIPDPAAGATVDYYITATDGADPANTATSPTWTFVKQDWTMPPQNVAATDDQIERVVVTWTAPAWAHTLLAAGPGDEPVFEDFLGTAPTKEAARQAWQEALAAWRAAQENAERAFISYRVYRADSLLGTTTSLTYTHPSLDVGVAYTYSVRALFDAGESDPGSDSGTAAPRPTSGGPDALGYTWVNSLDAGGPDFSWVEISGTGTNILSTGDDQAVTQALPFSFPFYEGSYAAVAVCTNGFLNFGAASTAYSNVGVPNTGVPNAVIFPFWDDLSLNTSGDIYYLDDSAGNDRVIFQWNAVPRYSGTGTYTFQAILNSDGSFTVQYLSMTGVVDNATVGCENTNGTIGLQVNLNGIGGSLADGVAVLFTPGAGDYIGPVIAHTPLADTEADGPYTVTADITDEDSNVAGATLHYRVNGGAYTPVAMTAGTPPAWSADIPDQTPLATVDYYIVAVDDSPNANDTTSPTWSFDVVDFTWPPGNLVASDGLLGEVQLTWTAPAPPAPLGTAAPQGTKALPTLEELMAAGMDKDAAWAWLQERGALEDAGRAFITYRVYRDGGLVGTTTSLSYVDIPPQAITVYEYYVTALFDAGESLASFPDTGFMTARPTSGGPDAYGYRWMNSDDPSGDVVYSWVEAGAGVGTEITALSNQDDTYTYVQLPRSLSFYGTTCDSIAVSTNGWVSFITQISSYFSNGTIPSATTPNGIIAPFWDDLDLSDLSGSLGHIYRYDDAANGRFIVQWDEVPHFSGTPTSPRYTFQLLLYDDGKVLVQYETMDGIRNSATVGIENSAGTVGLQVNYNDAGGRIGNALALRFSVDTTPPEIVHTPLTDTTAPGPFTVDADITDAESNVAGATLHYQVDAGGYTAVAMTAGTPPAWSAQIPVVTPPATVDYYITAVDDAPAANMATSPTWTFNVNVATCPTPTDVDAAISSGNAVLTWTAAPGATSYKVYVAANGYDTPTLLGTTTLTTYTHTGAQSLGRRFYQIVAVCP